jgi:hypothetical protein
LQFTVSLRSSRPLLCGSLFFAALSATLCCAGPATLADSAYINQATGGVAAQSSQQMVRPLPVATMPASSHTQRSSAFVPTPETAATANKSLNFAQTLEVGRSNQVAQFQAGQNNLSNVGVVGGTGNNVGVLQGGGDVSNLYLVNTQGLSVGVIQPKGAAPLNMLIARLPNGAILIKK